jgi:hypothetical protein
VTEIIDSDRRLARRETSCAKSLARSVFLRLMTWWSVCLFGHV